MGGGGRAEVGGGGGERPAAEVEERMDPPQFDWISTREASMRVHVCKIRSDIKKSSTHARAHTQRKERETGGLNRLLKTNSTVRSAFLKLSMQKFRDISNIRCLCEIHASKESRRSRMCSADGANQPLVPQ